MNVITIESEAFQQLINQLEEIKGKLNEKKKPLSELWLDNQDVCELLHCSKRTLQNYRDTKRISFSQIGAKIYYKTSDVELFLYEHYIKKTK